MPSSSPPPPEHDLHMSKRKSSGSSGHILTEKTIKRIKTRDRSLIGDEQNGKRELSLALLSPPASQTSSSMGSSSRSSSSLTTASSFVIPEELDSAYTYECMGLTANAARVIYNDGNVIRNNIIKEYGEDVDFDAFEASLEGYLITRVTETCERVLRAGGGDNWVEAMAAAGINDRLQNVIMDERFEVIRGTRSLSYWLVETFLDYFSTFEKLDRNIDRNIEYWDVPHLRGGGGEADVPPPPPGHKAMYKSIGYDRAQEVFEAGNLLCLMTSERTGDFGAIGGAYFTDQIWVAEFYATFQKQRCPPCDVRAIELHVPDEHFDKLKVWTLKFDDTWKELVWNCRRGGLIPKHLSKLQSDRKILYGPCSTGHAKTYRKLESWTIIEKKNLIIRNISVGSGKPKETMAMQYYWRDSDAVAELSRACVGKTYLRKPFVNWALVKDPENDVSFTGKGKGRALFQG
ncbi:hypothetical protein GMOD_00009599 [Pyrenophora seminiperda CCB06]|uniref:Uncharacterized protein n=1 Tax=Pyrenophora seminiperda CCB06 TaxID=1302712 RepID=A0A3M7MF46_9PLEO|nr:hypothetical protein GMOD_00009599 [Pyrenophora seminiperda CCB06]